MRNMAFTLGLLAVGVFAVIQAGVAWAGDGGSCSSSCTQGAAKAADSGSGCPFMKALASMKCTKSGAAQPQDAKVEPAKESGGQVASKEAVDSADPPVAAGTENEGESECSKSGESAGCSAGDSKSCSGSQKSCDKQAGSEACDSAGKSCGAK